MSDQPLKLCDHVGAPPRQQCGLPGRRARGRCASLARGGRAPRRRAVPHRGYSPGVLVDHASARHAIDFFGFLRHSKGEWAGQTFTLAPWQAFVVGCLFGWQRADGLRRFRTAYCAVPRKNGKSTLSAGIALYLLVADGEHGAEIYSAATTRDQARIVFDEAKRMVGSSPALRRRVGILINNLHVAATASRFMPLSSDASSPWTA